MSRASKNMADATIEILRDMKAGAPVTLSTGKGRLCKMAPTSALIDLLMQQVREAANAQLAALDEMTCTQSEPAKPPTQQAEAEAFDIDAELRAAVERIDLDAQAIARPTEAGRMIKAYFEHANDKQLRCWYVTHAMRTELLSKAWEEIEVEGSHRLKVCDLPVYPMHSYAAMLGACVDEGSGWKLVSHQGANANQHDEEAA